MKTDVITLCGDTSGHSDALREAEQFAAYHQITGKPAMHIRLLTEEAISMVHGILHDFKGSFWIEGEQTDKGFLCHICISADVAVNEEQEYELLEASRSGKNEDAKGILGMIREAFRRSMQQMAYDNNDSRAIAGHASMMMGNSAVWSLAQYRVNSRKNKEEFSDLERSVIAKLADDVRVGIQANKATVTIDKLIGASGGANAS